MDTDAPDITVLAVIKFESAEDKSVPGGVILREALAVLRAGRLSFDSSLVSAASCPQDAC